MLKVHGKAFIVSAVFAGIGYVVADFLFSILIGYYDLWPLYLVVAGVVFFYTYVGSLARFVNQYNEEVFEKSQDIWMRENIKRVDRDLGKILTKYKNKGLNNLPIPSRVSSKEVYVTNSEAFRKLSKWMKSLSDVDDKFDELDEAYGTRLGAALFVEDDLLFDNLVRVSMEDQIGMMLVNRGNYFDNFNVTRDAVKGIRNRYNALKKGIEGERLVEDEISKYFEPSRVLYGNRFRTQTDGTVENDMLVFTESGIYTLEVKNIMSEGDRYLKITKDGLWYFRNGIDSNWKLDEKSTKIFSQVNRHVYHTEKLVNDRLGKEIELKSIIVIANNNVVIENESDWVIVRPNMLYALMKPSRDRIMYTESELLEMVNLFKKEDLGEGKFPLDDYDSCIDEIKHSINFYSDYVSMSHEIKQLYDNTHPEYQGEDTKSLLDA